MHASGSYSPLKESKTEILFFAPRRTYQDKATLDDTNMDDITLPNGRFIPVLISKFRYLGSHVTRDCTDSKDVRARINSAVRAF